ncbi:MAG TPA: DUF2254 family protein [Longimicrobiaceae bacterium]|nr:DUF2254 family protein [Longimicrobiaceae bacterium]
MPTRGARMAARRANCPRQRPSEPRSPRPGQPARATSRPLGTDPPEPHVLSREAGYFQRVDEDALFSIAELGRAVIPMEVAIGDFVNPGEVLASVWIDDGEAALEETAKMVRSAFVIGDQWTLGQDVERAFIEVTDIAIRALSPSLNDPTTATQCVDRVGELLIRLGTRAEPPAGRTGEAGTIRFIALRVPWERAVDVGVGKIRPYAARSPSVLIRMIEVCGRVRAQVASRRRRPLEQQIRDIVEAARRTDTLPPDMKAIERAAEQSLAPIPAQAPALSD